MHRVDRLFVGDEYLTDVWMSEQALRAIAKYDKKHRGEMNETFKKVGYFARAGFPRFEGNKSPIRPEWSGVFRIAASPNDLFRLIGFYEDEKRDCFLLIDAFLKKGQSPSSAERGRIDKVAKVKRDRDWEKKSP